MKLEGIGFTRSWLFLPAHRDRFVRSASEAGSDQIVLDLEDAVPPASKGEARKAIEDATRIIADRAGKMAWVRLNGPKSDEVVEDIQAVNSCSIVGVVVPKVEDPADVEYVIGLLRDDLLVVLLIETALGVENLTALASVSPRIVGLMFGHEDYLSDVGHWAEEQSAATSYARGRLLNLAKSRKIFAIDTPFVDLNDSERLMATAKQSAESAFDGMIILHPRQVNPVNEAYQPRGEELLLARKIIDAAEASGGAVSFTDGTFVAPPLVKRARKMIDQFSGFNTLQDGER